MTTSLYRAACCILSLCITGALAAQLHFEHAFNHRPADVAILASAIIDDQLYLSANDGYFGYELWRFDAATQEAVRLTDIRALSGDAQPIEITDYAGDVYFTAQTDGDGGRQLFRYEPGSNQVVSVYESLPAVRAAYDLAVVDAQLYFVGRTDDGRAVYRYDAFAETVDTLALPAGLAEPTFPILRRSAGAEALFLQARRPDGSFGWWRYDTAAEGFETLPTQFDTNGGDWALERVVHCGDALLVGFTQGPFNRWAQYLPDLDSLAIFHGDFATFDLGSACIDDEFYYPTNDIEGIGIYTPTTQSVTFLRDRYDDAPDWSRQLRLFEGKLYLKSRLGIQQGVYTFDPDAGTTTRLDFMDGADPDLTTLVRGGAALFAFADDDTQREIFKYAPATTPSLWVDINQASKNGFSSGITEAFHRYRNRYYFNATGEGAQSEVWSLDTTTNTVAPLTDELDITGRAYIANLSTLVLNDRFYFSGNSRSDGFRQLVSFRPGEDSLRRELDISNNTQFPPYLGSLFAVNDDIYFSGFRDYPFSSQLFRFNTTDETYELLPGTAGLTGAAMLKMGERILFTGSDPDDPFNNKYYALNLLDSTLTQFSDDALSYDFGIDLRRLGDRVVYNVRVPGSNERYLELYDPQTGDKIVVLPAGFDAIRMERPTWHAGRWWWFYEDRYLFSLDAATGVCALAYDLEAVGVTPRRTPAWYNGQLYFSGFTEATGQELYRYEPALDTVMLAAEVRAAGGSGSPENLRVFNDRLYFTANDGVRGRELWSFRDCFSVSTRTTPDSLGMAAGQIEITTTGGTAPFTYTWNTGATGATLTGLVAGYYEAQVTDASGCMATVAVLLPGGLPLTATPPAPGLPTLRVYPNPTRGQLRVEATTSLIAPLSLALYSASGVQVRRFTLSGAGTNLNISDLPGGVYYLVGEGLKPLLVVKQ